ncbi:PKD domain-containing protein [Candidatus Parcubacteria bacterium]|nr:PKD domain-containing protein [Candidatus Parcubacteria bacterium]
MEIKTNNHWKKLFLIIAMGVILISIGFSVEAWDWVCDSWSCRPDYCTYDYECCDKNCEGECWYIDFVFHDGIPYRNDYKESCCVADIEYRYQTGVGWRYHFFNYQCCPGSSEDRPGYGNPAYDGKESMAPGFIWWRTYECCAVNERAGIFSAKWLWNEGPLGTVIYDGGCCAEPTSAFAPVYIEDAGVCKRKQEGSYYEGYTIDYYDCTECYDPSGIVHDVYSESCLSQSKTACCFGQCYDPNPTEEHPTGQQCCGNGCHPLLCDIGQACCDSDGNGVADKCCAAGQACCSTDADCPTGKVCGPGGCCVDCTTDDHCVPNPNVVTSYCGDCNIPGVPQACFYNKEEGVCNTDSNVCETKYTTETCGVSDWVKPEKYSCWGGTYGDKWTTQLRENKGCQDKVCKGYTYFGTNDQFKSCNGGATIIDENGQEQFLEVDGPCAVNTDKCFGIENAGAPCYCPGGCYKNTTIKLVEDCFVTHPPTDTGRKKCSSGSLMKEQVYGGCTDFTELEPDQPSFCSWKNAWWVTEKYCGGCDATGALRCGGGGVFQFLLLKWECDATVEEEWQCTECITVDADNAYCTTPPRIEWRIDPITGCCNGWGSALYTCTDYVGQPLGDIWEFKLDCAGVCVEMPPPTDFFPRCSCDLTQTWEMWMSCPCGCSGWLSVGLGGIFGPGLSCYQMGPTATQSCGKCGTQTFDGCVWGPCENEGVCTPGEKKNCACGGQQIICGDNCQWGPCPDHKECVGVECKCVGASGYDSCSDNNDCNTQTQHKECIDQKCLLIPGTGTNLCSQDTECVNQHRECNLQDSCVQVAGIGIDECLTDDNCPSEDPIVPHNECINRRCVSVPWVGGDLCQNDNNCLDQRRVCFGNVCIQRAEDGRDQCLCNEDCGEQNSPYIELLRALPETYCIGIPGCGEISFEWKYRDPDGDPESRFDIQVDDNYNFSSPEVDKSFFNLSYPDGATNTQLIDVRNLTTSPDCDYITFDQSYYVRVRVWDSTGLSSNWRAWTEIAPGVFDWKYQYYDYQDLDGDGDEETFYKDPHPWPAPDFIFLPPDPDTNEEIMFLDLSTCYDSNKNPYPCKNINPITSLDSDPNNDYNTYTWIFGDGNSNNDVGNTFHSYTASGIYPVTLYICDPSLGVPPIGCCWTIRNVAVRQTSSGSQAPEWREISPF